MVWLVVDCASCERKQRQPDDNNSNATQRLLRCQRRNKDCNAALSSRCRQRERQWWHCFCFCFCSYTLWGRVVPSLPAADIGVTATFVTVVIFVGSWHRRPTSGDKDGRTTMTTMQRHLHCQHWDNNGNTTATRHCCHGTGNASIVA